MNPIPPLHECLIPWAIGAAVLALAAVSLRGTTLRAPLSWCGVAWLLFAVVVLFDYFGSPRSGYALAVAPIFPVLAMLGAKRPQNGAWQFIVVTLAGVLLLPVLRGWMLDESDPHVHPLLSWLIAAHILLAVGNYLPTRYWGPALLFGVAETILVGPWLPVSLDIGGHDRKLYALLGFTIALCWARFNSLHPRLSIPGVYMLWRDFRDTYGTVWTLRVAERLNSTAKRHGWPVEFTWNGILVASSGRPASPNDLAFYSLPPELRRRIERELRSLLRRFVSHEWIVRRLPAAASDVPVSPPAKS